MIEGAAVFGSKVVVVVLGAVVVVGVPLGSTVVVVVTAGIVVVAAGIVVVAAGIVVVVVTVVTDATVGVVSGFTCGTRGAAGVDTGGAGVSGTDGKRSANVVGRQAAWAGATATTDTNRAQAKKSVVARVLKVLNATRPGVPFKTKTVAARATLRRNGPASSS